MFTQNSNAVRRRAKQEKKDATRNLSDTQDTIVALTEKVNEKDHEIADLQAQVLSLMEGGAK